MTGCRHERARASSSARAYRAHGLDMLVNHAAFEDGSDGVEAGLMDMLDRMQTGRLKVFGHLPTGSRNSGSTTARTAAW